MATAIVYTPGGDADNSLVTEAQANTYFTDTQDGDTWDTFGSEKQLNALVQATRDLLALGGAKAIDSAARPRLHGVPDSDTQSLHYPRTTDEDADGALAIPEAVQHANFEQAFWWLQQREPGQAPLVDGQALRNQGIQSQTQDGLSVTVGPSHIPEDIAPKAWKLFKPFVIRQSKLVV